MRKWAASHCGVVRGCLRMCMAPAHDTCMNGADSVMPVCVALCAQTRAPILKLFYFPPVVEPGKFGDLCGRLFLKRQRCWRVPEIIVSLLKLKFIKSSGEERQNESSCIFPCSE